MKVTPLTSEILSARDHTRRDEKDGIGEASGLRGAHRPARRAFRWLRRCRPNRTDRIDSGLREGERDRSDKFSQHREATVSSCHSQTTFPKASAEKVGQVRCGEILCAGPGNDHNVQARQRERVFMEPKPFAKAPLDPVPEYGVPEPLFHHEPQTMMGKAVARDIDDESPAGKASTFPFHPQVFCALSQSLLRTEGLRAGARCRHDRPVPFRNHTERRFLPLARLRLMTARPDLVAMRTKNPCVRFLLKLCGWNVRFMNRSFPFHRKVQRAGNGLSRVFSPWAHVSFSLRKRIVAYSQRPVSLSSMEPGPNLSRNESSRFARGVARVCSGDSNRRVRKGGSS